MFTYYLIKVAWGGDARVCAHIAINLMMQGYQILCCGVAKNRRSSFTKSVSKEIYKPVRRKSDKNRCCPLSRR